MDGSDHHLHATLLRSTCHDDLYASVRNQLLYDSLSSQPMNPVTLVKQHASGYSLRAGCSYSLPKGFPGPLVSRKKAHNLDGSMRFVVWNDYHSCYIRVRCKWLCWNPCPTCALNMDSTCTHLHNHQSHVDACTHICLVLMGTLLPRSDPCHFDCWDGYLALIMSAYSIRRNHHETLFFLYVY